MKYLYKPISLYKEGAIVHSSSLISLSLSKPSCSRWRMCLTSPRSGWRWPRWPGCRRTSRSSRRWVTRTRDPTECTTSMYVDRHTITNTNTSAVLSLFSQLPLWLVKSIKSPSASFWLKVLLLLLMQTRAAHSLMQSTPKPKLWLEKNAIHPIREPSERRKEQSTALLSFPTPVNYHFYGLLCHWGWVVLWS